MIFLNEEERYLSAHISDLAAQSRRSGIPRFSRFLNERERIVATDAARKENAEPVYYGGYDGAARTVCGFFDGTYAEDYDEIDGSFGSDNGCSKRELFPVCAVTFSFRESDGLCHRDFLGAIISLGLERSVIGDILVDSDYAVVFCTEGVAVVVERIEKIGRCGVCVKRGTVRGIPCKQVAVLDRTVSSLRLDCVVGACTNLSREKSAALIKQGLVSADFCVCQSISGTLKAGTILSIRGYGRFKLSEVFGETKKGRLRIKIEKSV